MCAIARSGREANPRHLIRGAWFHRSSWEGWAERFTSHGYAVCVPGWPGEAPTAEQVRRDPGPLRDLGLTALTAHYETIVRTFDNPPVLVGHSAGGLIAQHFLGAGLGRAAVAHAPLQAGGVPTAGPGRGRRDRPARPGTRASSKLPRARFRPVVANTAGAEEATRLFDRYAVPAPLRLLADLGLDRTPAGPAGTVVDTANTARGPLLLVSGQEDRLAPDAVTRSAYKRYGDSSA
ncbi:lysophospholipase [Kitasatospora sp. NBC_00085]|uniref:alpha/beta hydrolase n=1 Tax=unclassified Kitasatospora TaxID=2633591 RepID=UPI00324F1E77